MVEPRHLPMDRIGWAERILVEIAMAMAIYLGLAIAYATWQGLMEVISGSLVTLEILQEPKLWQLKTRVTCSFTTIFTAYYSGEDGLSSRCRSSLVDGSYPMFILIISRIQRNMLLSQGLLPLFLC